MCWREKKTKVVRKKKLIDKICESNVNDTVKDNVLSENVHSDIAVDDEVCIPPTLLNKPSNKLKLFKK